MKPTASQSDTTNYSGYQCVALLKWAAQDGIAQAIADELNGLGYRTLLFEAAEDIPMPVNFLITFGPYGNLDAIGIKVEAIAASSRPSWIHWNTEGMPDLRLPWPTVHALAKFRSWVSSDLDRQNGATAHPLQQVLQKVVNSRMRRFQYLGDYLRLHNRGLLNLLADTSEVYARIRSKHGLPTIVAPWGTTSRWYGDLRLERDIDVLWMGARSSRRRSGLLDQVRGDLASRGIEMYVADNVENPFIFGEERTRYLNRAKVTLNLTRTWYDDNFSRFALAGGNRSLIVSEPLLPHCSAYQAGVHYVSAPADSLAERIAYFLENEAERERITASAFDLVTTQVTLKRTVQTMLAHAAVQPAWQPRAGIVESRALS